MDEGAKEKKSGLQKKISSIFRGIPTVDESKEVTPGEAKNQSSGDSHDVPAQEKENLTKRLKEEMERKSKERAEPSQSPASSTPENAPEPSREVSVRPLQQEREQTEVPVAPHASTAVADFMNQVRAMGSATKVRGVYASPQIKPGALSSSIGLDLGECQYKLVRVGKKNTLEAVAFHEWSPTAEAPPDRKRKEDVLKGMVEQVGGIKTRTVVGIQGASVFHQVLKLPVLPRAERTKAVRWELTKKGMAPSGPSLIDYNVLDAKTAGRKVLVLAVAAQESFVASQMDIAGTAGLAVEKVSTTVRALTHVAKRGSLFCTGEDGAILDLGYGASTVCFFRGPDPQYVRTFGMGGKDFLKALTGTMVADGQTVTISGSDAQMLQKVVGIPSDEMLKSHPAKALLSQISVRLRPVLEDIAGELHRSLEFYVNSTGFGPVRTLYLSGGLAGMKNLDEFLAKEMGFAVKVLKPFDVLGLAGTLGLDDALIAAQPAFTVALGLAGRRGSGLALMPGQYRLAVLEKILMRWTKVVSVTAVAGFLLLAGGMKFWQDLLNRRLAACCAQYAAIEAPAQKCKKIQQIAKEIEEKERTIVGHALRQPLWEGVLKEISALIPDNVVVTEISLIPQSVPKSLKICGTIWADNLSADSQLSAFMNALATGPFFLSFDVASRKNLQEAKPPASVFEIRGELEY